MRVNSRLLGIAAFAFGGQFLSGAPLYAGTLTLENTSEYSTGNYGSPQSTDELYEAVSGKYEFGDTLLKLTVPYLYVVGPSDVVPGFGTVTNNSAVQRTARDGLGDIFVTADQEISPQSWKDTDIDVIGKVKFGTASFSRGLGTGENDYYAQLEWTERFDHGIETVIDGGRRFVESSAETGLHDVWYGSAGAIWHQSSATSFSAWFDMRQSAAPFVGEQMETTLQVSNKFAPDWKITLYGSKGLEPGSPNFTAGLTLAREFSL